MKTDVLITIATRLAKLIAGFAAAIITARYLGTDGRGEYFLVVTIALTVVQLGNFGLHASNTFDVARDRTLLQPLLANSLWLSLALGAGIAVAISGIAVAFGAFPDLPGGLVWYTVLLAPATLFFLFGTNLLAGVFRFRAYNALSLAGNLLVVLGLALAGILGLGPAGFLGFSGICWLLTGVAVLVVLRREAGRGLRFRPDVLRSAARYASRAWLTALLAFLVLRANVFILQHVSGSSELGRFSVASQVGDALVLLPTSVAIVLFPDLVAEEGARRGKVLRSCLVVGLVMALICLATAVIAGPLVRVVFGTDYSAAASMLQIMLPGIFCLSLATIISQYLAAIGIPWLVIVDWLATFVIVVIAGLLLVPGHGGDGAAAALSIADAFLLVALAVTVVVIRPAEVAGLVAVGRRHTGRLAAQAFSWRLRKP